MPSLANRSFIALQRVMPQHLLSRLVGLVASSRIRWVKNTFIRTIIRVFDVDLTEAESANIEDYPSFNAFFTRRLKPGSRPIEGLIASPADGCVSACGDLAGNQILQAKGLSYSVEKLLAGPAAQFKDGSFITVYLSPRDYHRVHMPVSGDLHNSIYVPGNLFSVNDTTAQLVPDLFAANERFVTRFDTPRGAVAVVMVGAMIVAGIKPAWKATPFAAKRTCPDSYSPPKALAQGEELGAFLMGSTAIVLLEKRVDWQVSAGDLVRMGQSLATDPA